MKTLKDSRGKPMRIFNIRIGCDDYQALGEDAYKLDLTMSALMRRMIKRYLDGTGPPCRKCG